MHRNNDLLAGSFHCLHVRLSAFRSRPFSESHIISQSSSGKSRMDIVERREAAGQGDDKCASMLAGLPRIHQKHLGTVDTTSRQHHSVLGSSRINGRVT